MDIELNSRAYRKQRSMKKFFSDYCKMPNFGYIWDLSTPKILTYTRKMNPKGWLYL